MPRKPQDTPAERSATPGRPGESGVWTRRKDREGPGSKTSARVITSTHRRRRKAMKELADR